MASFQGLRLGLRTKDLCHSLLICKGESVVLSVKDVRAGYTVRPGLEQRGCSKEGCRGVRHSGGPFCLLIGSEIVQADLRKHFGISGDTIALILY